MKLPKVTYNSPVILSFTLVAFAATLAGIVTGGEASRLLFSVYRGPLTNPLF